MEKTYHFKLRLEGGVKAPILNIKSINYKKKPAPYPISFSELNVPIIIHNRNYSGDSFDLEYFLDFEKGFDETGEKCDAFNRKNLIKVLSDLNRVIDEDLRKALCFESKLKPWYKVISDNGLEEYPSRRSGKPKTSKRTNYPRNLRKRLD